MVLLSIFVLEGLDRRDFKVETKTGSFTRKITI
jgi:hypothetical protein